MKLDRDVIDRIAERYAREVVPLLEAKTVHPCGCVTLTYSARVISMCCTHASRRY